MTDSTFNLPMFGEKIEIIVKYIDKFLVEDIIKNAHNEGLRLSKIFNFYDESSELSILNEKRKLIVSDELLIVIKKALELSVLTEGNYDITLGKKFIARKKGEDSIKLNCSYKDIRINNQEITLLHPDVLIDLGSIAKGYIVDKITEYLMNEGIIQGIVNGRGDLRVFGEDEQTLGIQHPRQTNQLIKQIKLVDKSVATSGDYNQYNKIYSNSHIINQKDIISITVIAENLMTADVFATALFVTDKKTRENILKKNKDIQVLTIDKDLKLNYYNGFEKLIVDEIKNEI